MSKIRLSMQKLAGKGYGRAWFKNNHSRYRVFCSARNTKKSYVILGLEIICKILSNPLRNVLVLRQIAASNRLSTFSTLVMLINQPDFSNPGISLARYFKINEHDMVITYKTTGQKILFAGLYPDPSRIKSMRVSKGFITDVYVEEAYEIKDEEGWRQVDGTFRGKLPDGLFHQITFCMNPWSKNHWIYEHFFKDRMEDDFDYLMTHDYQDYYDPDLIIDYGKGLYLHKATYKINEFRDYEIYDAVMANMEKVAPEIFRVEGLGMWNNNAECTYPEMSDKLIVSVQDVLKERFACFSIGIDTGLSDGEGNIKRGDDVKLRSATTMQLLAITKDYKTVYCVDEFFHSNENVIEKKTEPQLQTDIILKLKEWIKKYGNHNDLMKGTILVYVDCADKGYRQCLEIEASRQQLRNVRFIASSKKVRIIDRIMFVRRLMAYDEFKICDQCENLIREFRHSQQGEKGEPREDINDHAINANEYAWIPFTNYIRRWADYKEVAGQ